MITGIESIKSVFEKVIVDLDLQMKDLDTVAFTQWASEAIEHIGGLHRWCPYNMLKDRDNNDIIEVVANKVRLPQFVVKVDEVLYTDVLTEDFKLAERTRNNFSDAKSIKDPTVYDVRYIGGSNDVDFREQFAVALFLNKKNGYVKVKIQMLPVMEVNGEPELLVPTLASYKDAVYWYIVYKLAWRDVWRGKNKSSQQQYAAGMWNNQKQLAYGELMMPEFDEVQALANELSLGISYTGISKNKVWRDFYGKFADNFVLKGY